MRRVNGPTATPARGFSGGTQALGYLDATLVPDWWLTQTQEEAMSILAAAGVAPDETGVNLGQVLAALRALFDVKAIYSGVNNGLIMFPGGMIHTTFTAQVPGGGGIVQTLVNLPTPFPTQILDASLCYDGTTPPTDAGSIAVQPQSRTAVMVTTNFSASTTLGVVIKCFGN